MWYSGGVTYTLTIGPNGTIIAPPGLLADLALGEGDRLEAMPLEHGFLMVPDPACPPEPTQQPSLEEQMAVGREMMRKYRGALKRLAE